jgi:hypothetical protein
MASFDPHDWSVTALFAALFAVSLALQSLPVDRSARLDTGVCEKPGIAALGAFLPFH